MKKVKQISVLLENKPGAMSAMSELLGKEGINIVALTLSEHADRSVVRLVSDNPSKTTRVLKNSKSNFWEDEVLAAVTPDHPGGLNAVLRPLSAAGINVEYFYSCLHRHEDNAIIIFRVGDMKKAAAALKDSWILLLGDELYSL